MHKDVLREFKSCLDNIDTTLDGLVTTSDFLASKTTVSDDDSTEYTSETMIAGIRTVDVIIDELIKKLPTDKYKPASRMGSPTSVLLFDHLKKPLLSDFSDYDDVMDPCLYITNLINGEHNVRSLVKKINDIISRLRSIKTSEFTNLKKEMKGTTKATKVFSSRDIAVNSKVSSFVKACIGVEEEQSESVIRTTFDEDLDGASLVICREKLIRAKESIKALDKVDEENNDLGPNR